MKEFWSEFMWELKHHYIPTPLRRIVAASTFLCIMVLVGCADDPDLWSQQPDVGPVTVNSDAGTPDAQPDAASTRLVPLAHPPGTLLRDSHQRHWVVGTWPDREIVLPRELGPARLDTARAIPMSEVEEMCLRQGRLFNSPRINWLLSRLPDGRFFYTDLGMHNRREATSAVMRAWHDDPDAAIRWEVSMELFENLHDLGPMQLPNGTLILTPEHLYYYFNGEAHAFASEDLARQAGYNPAVALELSETDLRGYAEVGEQYTAQIFQVCPMAVANARRDDDEDSDGSTRGNDCDDRDSRRAPHLVEICDAIDNDCDGAVDNGFDVGRTCVLDDGCDTPGRTQCNYDGLSVSCQNDMDGC